MLEILNFVLCISNNLEIVMRKAFLPFIVVVLILISAILWLVNSNSNTNFEEILQIGIIIVLVSFGIYFGLKRLISLRKKQPTEDELSKKMMTKASSLSYFISIYLWLVLMYISGEGYSDTEVLFGWGILGMAVIFLVSWVIIYFVGIPDE